MFDLKFDLKQEEITVPGDAKASSKWTVLKNGKVYLEGIAFPWVTEQDWEDALPYLREGNKAKARECLRGYEFEDEE